jgi:hypothetical protein
VFSFSLSAKEIDFVFVGVSYQDLRISNFRLLAVTSDFKTDLCVVGLLGVGILLMMNFPLFKVLLEAF